MLNRAKYGVKIGRAAARATLRDWEQGRRMPEGPARTLLGMVDADPDAAFKLLAKIAA